jgi:hypothetical protein
MGPDSRSRHRQNCPSTVVAPPTVTHTTVHRGVGWPRETGSRKHSPPAGYIPPRLKTERFFASRKLAGRSVFRGVFAGQRHFTVCGNGLRVCVKTEAGCTGCDRQLARPLTSGGSGAVAARYCAGTKPTWSHKRRGKPVVGRACPAYYAGGGVDHRHRLANKESITLMSRICDGGVRCWLVADVRPC